MSHQYQSLEELAEDLDRVCRAQYEATFDAYMYRRAGGPNYTQFLGLTIPTVIGDLLTQFGHFEQTRGPITGTDSVEYATYKPIEDNK